MALSGLGLVDAASGNYERAEQLLAEARDLFRRAGDRWGLTGVLWNSADLAVTRGDLDAAVEALEEALAVQREAGRGLWIAQTLTHLAEVALAQDEPERARTLLLEARDLTPRKAMPWSSPRSRAACARQPGADAGRRRPRPLWYSFDRGGAGEDRAVGRLRRGRGGHRSRRRPGG